MPRLFKKSQRYNVSKNSWLAKILLLDGTSIEINLQPDVTGADCLERVAQCMEILEIDYFGLQYSGKDGYVRWVDRDKSLRKQLEKYHIHGARNAELMFYVQFYVTSVTKLEYEITRYLYFLQLKHSVLTGRLVCTNEVACKLASYALQAAFGDYDEHQHTDAFLEDCILFPPNIEPPSLQKTLIDKVSKLHQRHHGMSAAAAELTYIKLAQQLPEYGHEPLQQLDVSGSKIWIGACFIGVFIKHSNGQPTVYFKWPEIFRMKVKDKNFGIETYQETVYFKLSDNSSAQYVLKMMVQQHMFFRTEYEYVKWVANGHSKKKSSSLHDIRSHALFNSGSRKKRTTSVSDYEAKDIKPRKFSRPLGKPVQRDSYLEPLSPARSIPPVKNGESMLVEEGMEISHSPQVIGDQRKPPVVTPTAWLEEQQQPHEQQQTTSPQHQKTNPGRIKGLSRTKVIETIDVGIDMIDIGEPLSDTAMATATASPSTQQQSSVYSSPTTSNNQPLDPTPVPNGGLDILDTGPIMASTYPQPHPHQHSPSVGENSVSGGSHESINLMKKSNGMQIGGSLDNFPQSAPPRAVKVRDYAAEQWEKVATSGTRDKRGQSLEDVLSLGTVYSEFEEIPKSRHDPNLTSGSLPDNIIRNRYKDILPYEDTRVVLNADNNVHHNNYINASHVKFETGGYTHHYIVAQGPLESTTGEFWQMIWEQNIQIILMLTNEYENRKVKCHRYYPSNEDKTQHVQFDQYRIVQRFIETSKTTISRGLTVKHIPTGEEREITQMQYIDWPDHGIPENPQPFIDFIKEVQSLKQRSSAPVVVHCSAGVGRSGVLVLVDMLMGQNDSGEEISVPAALQSLRYQRMHLVQTLGQYKFVYEILIHYIKTARLI